MIQTIAGWAGDIAAIVATACLFIKPLREKFLGIQASKDAQRCLLRDAMLRTYYSCVDKKEIRQYELQNFLIEYDSYKKLKGNSFIDDIHSQVVEWKVIQ